jgi:E3 ubiquitin-protein ligase TRIP12
VRSTQAVFGAGDLKLIAGQDPHLSKEELVDHIVISHGYTEASPQIPMLLEVLEEFYGEDQAAFIRFVTGVDKLPIGGLGNLKPSLTIALMNIPGQDTDKMLPSVMTCANYFKLSEYSEKDIMRAKLKQAIMDGQDSFLLS